MINHLGIYANVFLGKDEHVRVILTGDVMHIQDINQLLFIKDLILYAFCWIKLCFQFDYLKSLEIEEKINKIRWCQTANNALFLLSTNDKTIKYWKVCVNFGISMFEKREMCI